MNPVLILQNVGEGPQYFAEWLHYPSRGIWSVRPSEHPYHVMERRHLSSLVFIRDLNIRQSEKQFFSSDIDIYLM